VSVISNQSTNINSLSISLLFVARTDAAVTSNNNKQSQSLSRFSSVYRQFCFLTEIKRKSRGLVTWSVVLIPRRLVKR